MHEHAHLKSNYGGQKEPKSRVTAHLCYLYKQGKIRLICKLQSSKKNVSNSYKKDEIYSLHYFLKSLHFDLTVSVPDNFTYFKFDLKLTLRFLNNWLFCFIAVS